MSAFRPRTNRPRRSGSRAGGLPINADQIDLWLIGASRDMGMTVAELLGVIGAGIITGEIVVTDDINEALLSRYEALPPEGWAET